MPPPSWQALVSPKPPLCTYMYISSIRRESTPARACLVDHGSMQLMNSHHGLMAGSLQARGPLSLWACGEMKPDASNPSMAAMVQTTEVIVYAGLPP